MSELDLLANDVLENHVELIAKRAALGAGLINNHDHYEYAVTILGNCNSTLEEELLWVEVLIVPKKELKKHTHVVENVVSVTLCGDTVLTCDLI